MLKYNLSLSLVFSLAFMIYGMKPLIQIYDDPSFVTHEISKRTYVGQTGPWNKVQRMWMTSSFQPDESAMAEHSTELGHWTNFQETEVY
jgi:hypothetical protein